MRSTFFLGLLLLGLAGNLCAQPAYTLDLAQVFDGDPRLFRLLGSGPANGGNPGVPVAGGFDMDGDGKADFAMGSMLADPLSRTDAGQVFLVFGDGTTTGKIDTKDSNTRVLNIYGDQVSEHAGSELWMADVTGDDLGDLIICRQDYSPPSHIGGGALTLIPGQAQLRTMATNGDVLDLQAPPVGLQVITILGATTGSRLCIWARTGDVTGDGIDDIVVGADRETSNGDSDSGAAYVFRGGAYLATSQTIDLVNFGTVIPGNVARIRPIDGSINFHFGATVQIGDLDDNGTAEVLVAAALNRSGAGLGPAGGSGEGSGGAPGGGTLYIAWDDNFSGNWIPAPNTSLDFIINDGPGGHSSINGDGVINDINLTNKNKVFGEEILGGLDYDNDGNADLFAGDLTASGWGSVSRFFSGTGHVLYNAAILKGQDFDLKDGPPPVGFKMSTFIGPSMGAIGGDTAMHGDFDGDGIDDLAFSSPDDDHFGRINSGTIHILLGRTGGWPAVSDLAPNNFPSSADITILEIYGAKGEIGTDAGDTLSYSGAFGDMNGDGVTDIITNEMLGNGSSAGAVDVGHLLLLDIKHILYNDVLFKHGFEAP